MAESPLLITVAMLQLPSPHGTFEIVTDASEALVRRVSNAKRASCIALDCYLDDLVQR